MQLSEIGSIAGKYWYDIPQHFHYVKLDAFIVMPNHIHGIIIIDKSVETSKSEKSVETPKLGVSTSISTNAQQWKSGTLGVIINQYKRICTINARLIEPEFSWQPRFYDTIIRDEKTFIRIAEYIRKNIRLSSAQ